MNQPKWVQIGRGFTGLVLGGLLAAAPACGGGSPVRAAADWDRGVDLSPKKTFSVARSRLLPPNLTPEQEGLVSMVETLTKRTLAEKGYVEAPAASADLIATSHFMLRERLGVKTYTCANYYQHEMYEAAVLPGGAVTPCQESAIAGFAEGTLMIDVYDTHLQELVWHGWASAPRPVPGSQDAQQVVQRATLDILDHFPP
jgi:hypothetical protein